MDVQMKKTGNTTTVKMDGPLTIEHAAELKTLISNVPGESEEIVVDLGGVTDIDLSCIQLLCSANLSLGKARKPLIRKSPSTKVITQALSEAGYAGEMGCHGKPCKNCFWKGEDI